MPMNGVVKRKRCREKDYLGEEFSRERNVKRKNCLEKRRQEKRFVSRSLDWPRVELDVPLQGFARVNVAGCRSRSRGSIVLGNPMLRSKVRFLRLCCCCEANSSTAFGNFGVKKVMNCCINATSCCVLGAWFHVVWHSLRFKSQWNVRAKAAMTFWYFWVFGFDHFPFFRFLLKVLQSNFSFVLGVESRYWSAVLWCFAAVFCKSHVAVTGSVVSWCFASLRFLIAMEYGCSKAVDLALWNTVDPLIHQHWRTSRNVNSLIW